MYSFRNAVFLHPADKNSFYVTKRAHRNSLVQTAGAPERSFAVQGLFCGVLGRGRILSGSSGLNGLSIVLAEQQTLVLVQLLLTAAQINCHSSKGTCHSGKSSDNSDQTRFFHRFCTLLFRSGRCSDLFFQRETPSRTAVGILRLQGIGASRYPRPNAAAAAKAAQLSCGYYTRSCQKLQPSRRKFFSLRHCRATLPASCRLLSLRLVHLAKDPSSICFL